MPSSEKIIELQKLYQSSKKPLWMIHPRSKFYVYPYYLTLGLTVGVSLYYTGRALLGIKASK
ncbi:hypothetical protein PACTADRAFT_185081 [Pachysolen tannophilus NRRL Y-2460]|uniref:Cytochrome c oxidase subunit 7 n=1 Tax=Pachysolen tannophilus NRRL Y-2460 TaxID=669874 RepID=A0A1E4U320_PACTA|nr:hypothetical protein PACTADRAFT_185081 [Pachysolen tannophilus NRRL Y-2460]